MTARIKVTSRLHSVLWFVFLLFSALEHGACYINSFSKSHNFRDLDGGGGGNRTLE